MPEAAPCSGSRSATMSWWTRAGERDVSWMEALKTGDLAAYGDLYDAHHLDLSRWVIRKYRVSEHDAKDIASETLVIIRDKCGQFDPSRGSFLAWRNVIAGRLCLTALRRKRCLTSIASEPDACRPLELRKHADRQCVEDLLAVLKAIEHLPGKQRDAVRKLIRAEMAGRDLPELCEPTFAARLHQARKKLRAWFQSGSKGGPGSSAGTPSGSSTPPKTKPRTKSARKLEAARALVDARVVRLLNVHSRESGELALLLEALDLEDRPSRFRKWLGDWNGGSFIGICAVAAIAVVVAVTFQLTRSQRLPVPASRPSIAIERIPPPYRDAVQHALLAKTVDRAVILNDLYDSGTPAPGETASRDATNAPSPRTYPNVPAPTPGAQLLDPVGVVVEPDHPTFRWQGSKDAAYLVSIYDEAYNQVAQSGWVSGQQTWTIPKSLERGARYSWRLSVHRATGVTDVLPQGSIEARFRILSAAGERELSTLRASYPDSHLLLGVVCARLGLLQEAEEQLRKASSDDPNSPAIGALLESVQKLRN